MWNLLKRLFRSADKPVTLFERSQTTAFDTPPDDFKWMEPPATMSDSAPWDQYWYDQLRYGAAGWVHMFCNDGELVDVMRANGLKTVLCIGSGISFEPHALARVGFEVTALDLSRYALEMARRATPPDDVLASLVDNRSAQAGGSVQFVAGDLRDPTCCPGPYDVIIERKTRHSWRWQHQFWGTQYASSVEPTRLAVATN